MIPKLCIQLLVENAVRSITTQAPPWHVSIICTQDEREWRVTVSDNGPGFDPEVDRRLRAQMDQILADGAGVLNERYERLKKRLHEEGYFDEAHKKPIPKFIRTLGVVTASTGAAVRDIIHITMRRNPGVQIILYPAIVQGDQAADSIITGIHALEDLGVDTIIIGRGGGSIEDLWAFNEEKVAQAVFDCAVPVISAVGHETDTVITDYVADLRAPTPSAAAELAVYDYERFRDDMEAFYNSLNQSMQYRLDRCREKTRTMQLQLQHLSPAARIRQQRMEAARYADRLQARMRMRLADSRARLRIGDSLTYSMNRRLSGTKHRMQVLAARMEALSPLARLSGGYGFVTDSRGKGVFTVDTLREGDLLRVRLRDGSVRTRVEEIERTAPAQAHTQGETGRTDPAETHKQEE
jgi:exodeoxyribonuclease VII large subunit